MFRPIKQSYQTPRIFSRNLRRFKNKSYLNEINASYDSPYAFLSKGLIYILCHFLWSQHLSTSFKHLVKCYFISEACTDLLLCNPYPMIFSFPLPCFIVLYSTYHHLTNVYLFVSFPYPQNVNWGLNLLQSPLYSQEPGTVPGTQEIHHEGTNENQSTQPSIKRRKRMLLLCTYI